MEASDSKFDIVALIIVLPELAMVITLFILLFFMISDHKTQKLNYRISRCSN